jgi:Ni/Co efflux regulator RcnB
LRNIGAVRRLLSLALTLAIAAGPLAAGGGAVAKDHRDERGGGRPEQQQRGRGDEGRWGGGRQAPPGWRGGEDRGGGGGGRFERADPRFQRGDPRGEFRVDPRGEMDPRAYGQREGGQREGGYAPAPRRGGVLSQGGPVIDDYNRFHLRAPPRGFDWVRTPGGMALVHRDSGRVYDVVPY